VSAPLQLYLIRHGQTAWSLSGQHTGRTDLPLTAEGEQMARELAPSLQAIRFARVLTSPRLRARTTCELSGLGATAEIEPDLAEWDYGEYEGMRTSEVRVTRPDWHIWRDGCPGGESPAEVSARADRVLASLGRQDGAVAIFSHGELGRVLAARWIELSASAGQHLAFSAACVGILGYDDGHPDLRVLSLWNAPATSLQGGAPG
jgi:broad specificity phosphatase PhoE